jgi:hypothetical protein
MIFEYTDMNNRPAYCDIEKIGDLIIMTKLAENTGASVTNSNNYIAKQYTEQNNLSINDLTFIERYDERSYEFWRKQLKAELPTYALVNFTTCDNAGKLVPNWNHLSSDGFNELIEKEKQNE